MQPFEQLEKEFAEFVGVPPENMVLCSSGTAALHLSLEAFQLPLGISVVMSEFAMIACPRAVTLAGMTPVFVDCGDDLLIDCEQVPLSDVSRPAAVMAVHIYGRRCNMDRLAHQSTITRYKLIEDLAEAHGIKPHPQTDAACFSFYRNKIIAGEEGGAVAFKNPEHAKLARCLRSMGFTDKHDFSHIPRAHNYRMSNAHANLILPSLHAYPENASKRRQVERWYDERIPDNWRMPARDAVWVYDLRIPGMTGDVQDRIVRILKEQGIPARHAFKPCSSQQEYSYSSVGVANRFVSPNAYRLANEVLYLPVDPGMTEADVERNVNALIAAVE